MHVAIVSYPMLFQGAGGLQVQILETIAALNRRGVDARLIDPIKDRLTSFDLVHVFSAINGNHRMVQSANQYEVPVVVSPLIQPHWNKWLGRFSRMLDSVAGKLTSWNVKTEYRQIAACLAGSDALLALGEAEKRSIVEAFQIPSSRIRVVPNGVPLRFFSADPEPFCQRFGIEPGFVLNVASVSVHKNQLSVARALAGTGHRLVIIGPTLSSRRSYVERVKQFSHVRLIGALDYGDPLLPSAYAAASVFCLPSLSEVMPLSVIESLAAGTAAVMTRNHCMDLDGMGHAVATVDPKNVVGIRNALSKLIATPPDRDLCRDLVRRYTWDAAAEAIHRCYSDVLDARARRTLVNRPT